MALLSHVVTLSGSWYLSVCLSVSQSVCVHPEAIDSYGYVAFFVHGEKVQKVSHFMDYLANMKVLFMALKGQCAGIVYRLLNVI